MNMSFTLGTWIVLLIPMPTIMILTFISYFINKRKKAKL